MAWRNQGITGSNNIPLGKRRFGGDGNEDGVANGSASPNGFANGDRDIKRGRSPERTFSPAFCPSPAGRFLNLVLTASRI